MGQILASQPGDKNRRLLYRVNIKPHEGQRRKGGGWVKQKVKERRRNEVKRKEMGEMEGR